MIRAWVSYGEYNGAEKRHIKLNRVGCDELLNVEQDKKEVLKVFLNVLA